MQSAIILGAGMVGVSSALHLQRHGWSVVPIDRKAPGQETSYGNAGIIQSEAVRPYAMPRDLWSLAKIAARRTNDVHYRLRSPPAHLGPLFRYWRHSSPKRYDKISTAYARIIACAASEHDELIREAGAGSNVRREGYRQLHRKPAALEAAAANANKLHAHYGINFRVLSAGELYVMAPMAKGLRITTGAELTGPNAPATPVQLNRAEAAARQLVDLGKSVEANPWYGTRPCISDMLPVLGRARRHRGLWMNFGHGHQGFTLGPITGRLLSELMRGETPAVDTLPYRPDRF